MVESLLFCLAEGWALIHLPHLFPISQFAIGTIRLLVWHSDSGHTDVLHLFISTWMYIFHPKSGWFITDLQAVWRQTVRMCIISSTHWFGPSRVSEVFTCFLGIRSRSSDGAFDSTVAAKVAFIVYTSTNQHFTLFFFVFALLVLMCCFWSKANCLDRKISWASWHADIQNEYNYPARKNKLLIWINKHKTNMSQFIIIPFKAKIFWA